MTSNEDFIRSAMAEHVDEVPPIGIADKFWDARDHLGVIRDAAHARQRPADSLLANVLGRWALKIHPRFRLPAIVGTYATFDLIVMIAGPSGSAKTTSSGIARELVSLEDDTDVIADYPIGSGEGFIESMLEYPLNDKGKPDRQRHKIVDKRGGLFTIDEGEGFLRMVRRDGATLASNLCSAWSGAPLGQANASLERRRFIPNGRCRFVFTGSMQYGPAGDFLTDRGLVGMGLPQRVTWFAATDRRIPDLAPNFPELELPSPPTLYGGPLDATYISMVDSIAGEIRERDKQKQRGLDLLGDPLDSHIDLQRLKLAGLLSTLDGRTRITPEDWDLAEMIVDASVRLRKNVLYHAKQARAEAARVRTEQIRSDERARVEVQMEGLTKVMEKVPVFIAEHGPMTRSEIRRKLSVPQRRVMDQALEELIEADILVAEAVSGQGQLGTLYRLAGP